MGNIRDLVTSIENSLNKMADQAQAAAAPATIAMIPPVNMRRGTVKQALSGDSIVIQGPRKANGAPEATVYLSNVSAPRLGRRPTDSASGTPDEAFAWEAREFLRKKLVGQTVTFIKDYTATSGRDHGRVYLGGTNPENAENITESAVAAGMLEVRPGKISDDYTTKLTELQEQAKSAGLGRWGDAKNAIREVKWVIENPRTLVDHYKQKPVDAVVEMVRDGSTVRALLLPSFEYITLQLSGVKAPSSRPGTTPEPLTEESRFFTEVRLLQQDIQVILESVSNQNLVGSILHPKGNIAESLLREGLAKCVDWSIGLCTGGAEKLRTAEKVAKDKKLGVWSNYQPSTSGLSADRKAFSAKVVEVVMSDALVVRRDDGTDQKIHLSSIRLPRESDDKPATGRQFRPLYDVPFMFQAREFLRKRLIGKKVNVTIDYIQPKSDTFPEKTCCTVKIGDQNIAEALVAKGLSKVVRHRSDDDNRSTEFDALLAAEANAEKGKKGLFADKSVDKKDILRVQELQGDLARSKQFLPYLQRGARSEGVVEFVSSGSRMRVYIPKETCVITFLLGGINCPKGPRPGGPGGSLQAGEPFAEEALVFTKNLILQHEVEIEVDGVDKTGNFIGYLFVVPEGGGRPQNLCELLLEQGLATLHFTAEKSSYYGVFSAAESRAKAAKRNYWSTFTEEVVVDEAAEAQAQDTSDRRINYKKVAVTDVQKGSLKFAAQLVEDGAKLEKMMGELRDNLQSNPPMTGSYAARRGDLCAAKFSLDNQWYRAKVESVRQGSAEILFIDYGNRETVSANTLAQLPAGFNALPPGAKEYALALTAFPAADKDHAEACENAAQQLLFAVATADLNVEYRVGTTEYAQVIIEVNGQKVDVGKTLIEDGFATVEKRREQRLQDLLNSYLDAEKKARRERRNIWEFGDFTGSEL